MLRLKTINLTYTKFLQGLLLSWLAVSGVLLVTYVLFFEWIWQAWHYLVWPSVAGGLIWKYQHTIKATLSTIQLPTLLKFVLLGYGLVLIEETLAALLNHLSEGFSLTLYLKRVGQFWALNVLAFSGIIWGGYIVFSRWQYSRKEMFCIIGLFGQFSERLLFFLFTPEKTIAALTLIPWNFLIYGTMFLPAIFLLEDKKRKTRSKLTRYSTAFIVIFIVSIPFVAFLEWSRELFPEVYPPRKFVP